MSRAVGYVRVSTDDKGQDPARQTDVIRPWCEREGVELVDVVTDEGTSASKTNPLDRPAFVAACERAQALGASAVVVETADRFGRRGSMESAWAEFEMGRRYGLKLWRADKPLALHGSMLARVTDTIADESAKDWVEKHADKVRSGMARKKAAGARFGRPPKPLTAEELALVARLRVEGRGWRKCAVEISKRRGAADVADLGAKRKRTVSRTHVQRQFEAWEAASRDPGDGRP